MSSSTMSHLSACTGALRSVGLATRAIVAATGYFFYGYWFSHKRA